MGVDGVGWAATVGCIYNFRLYLQLSVALQLPVALPYVHQGARRVIGATAKPLYVIDRKTEGFVGRVTLWETIA